MKARKFCGLKFELSLIPVYHSGSQIVAFHGIHPKEVL